MNPKHLQIISKDLSIREKQVESTVKLLNEAVESVK